MNVIESFSRAAIAACIPILGTLGLTQVDLVRTIGRAVSEAAAGGNPADAVVTEIASFAPLLAVLYSLSALPVILLLLPASRLTKWAALGLSALLLLAHSLHVIEHLLGSDYLGVVLIVVTSVVPYALVLVVLRKADPMAR